MLYLKKVMKVKLVAAICPNCGAKLDVNPNEETVVCNYCSSRIIIQDAIAKYKIEISGKVEIANLPKVENYIKIAERHLNDCEYQDAFEYYKKAIELDPENSFLLLRYEMCRIYMNDEIDYLFDRLMKYYHEYITTKKEEDTSNITSEIISLLKSSFEQTKDYYTIETLDDAQMKDCHKKLLSIIKSYQLLLELFPDNKELIKLLYLTLKEDVRDKSYNTVNGSKIFKLSKNEKNEEIKQMLIYQEMLQEKDEKKENQNISTGNILSNILIFIYRIIIVLLDIGSIIDKMYMSAVVLSTLLVLSIKKLNVIKDNKVRKITQVILFVIWIIVMIITSK